MLVLLRNLSVSIGDTFTFGYTAKESLDFQREGLHGDLPAKFLSGFLLSLSRYLKRSIVSGLRPSKFLPMCRMITGARSQSVHYIGGSRDYTAQTPNLRMASVRTYLLYLSKII
uniref:Uncharacterized protein n=1 Tax=Cacopsylla melanoneura TaxID=428564 RepID=A0A8D9B5K8_9HEMI